MHTPETSIYIALVISSAVLLLVLAYFTVTLVRQHRRIRRLYQEKIRAEIQTLEEERKRIAADLHDELGPLLSSVRLRLGCLTPSDPEDESTIRETNQHLDDILYRLREISNNLMPRVLLRKGLAAAIREFTDGIHDTGRLVINFYAAVGVSHQQPYEGQSR